MTLSTDRRQQHHQRNRLKSKEADFSPEILDTGELCAETLSSVLGKPGQRGASRTSEGGRGRVDTLV